jgi:hypothetical protein
MQTQHSILAVRLAFKTYFLNANIKFDKDGSYSIVETK